MRTTVTIRDDLHEAARRKAFEERRTMGDVLNELIELGLAQTPKGGRQLGRFVGEIVVASDFDDPLESLEVALDEPTDL
jgi:hypothetical protein